MSDKINDVMIAGQELSDAAVNFAIRQMEYGARPANETGTALGLQRAAIRYARAVDVVLHREPKPTLQERARLVASKVIPKAILDHFCDAK